MASERERTLNVEVAQQLARLKERLAALDRLIAALEEYAEVTGEWDAEDGE